VYEIHALSKQLVSTNGTGTLHFKDPPNWLFKLVDSNPSLGKNIFNGSDDLINECFENLRQGTDRDELEEILHWKLNKFDQIILPHILSNSTKGYERNQLIKMLLVLLGLISINSNKVTIDINKCKIICMALGLTTTGMLIYNIYIYYIYILSNNDYILVGWSNISQQLNTGIPRVFQILERNSLFAHYMIQENVSTIAWSINVLKVAMNYSDHRLANTIWSNDKGIIIIYY
jgi:hypothetical protein